MRSEAFEGLRYPRTASSRASASKGLAISSRGLGGAAVMRLLDLSENELDGVLLAPTLAVASLGRLACTCKALHGLTVTDGQKEPLYPLVRSLALFRFAAYAV